MEEKGPPTPPPSVTPGVAFLALGIVCGGCVGPERGRLAEWRGRTALMAEAEETEPPPLGGAPSGGVRAFPVFFSEHTGSREVLEVLWPVFESARSSRSSYLRVRPFFWRDRAPDREGLFVFPFYWHSLER